MPKEPLTITLEAERRADLDRLAKAQGRDRDTLQAWQTREIEAGLQEAAAGNFTCKAEVEAAYGRR